MNQYLIDNTREYLVGAAEHALQKEVGDLRVQILALPACVQIRACMGGIFKTWLSDTIDWEKLARAKENPLIGLIDGILFRLERQAVAVAGGAESIQKSKNGDGEQDTARA